MGNPGQIQTKVTPPAVLHLGAIKAKQRTGTDGDRTLPTTGSTKTYGVNPKVAPRTTPAKLSPKDCTTEQLRSPEDSAGIIDTAPAAHP